VRTFLRAVLLAAIVLPRPAHAQPADTRRPVLVAGADTNDAQAYYQYGLAQLQADPRVAASAFHWAHRLDPFNAEALYARRIALLLSDKSRLMRYWRGERSTLRRADIKGIDSLYYRALMLNPFLYEKLDRMLQEAVIQEIIRESTIGRGGAGELEYEIEQYLARASHAERAYRAYTDGRFKDALQFYASAINQERNKHYFRNMRGRLFYQLGEADSALTELSRAVEDLRKRDAKDLVYVYESKALFEHSLGMVHERLGNKDKAREAYGRALQEDLSYAPAHVRMAFMATDTRDTATALSEFDLAVQLHPEDAGLRYQYGYLLSEAGRRADAEMHLRKAVELNPVFAAPHYGLARLYQASNRPQDAVASYRVFLALSGRQDPRRAEATQRLQALAAGSE
jgi:tetratricopeptide (TPR) repeat protein